MKKEIIVAAVNERVNKFTSLTTFSLRADCVDDIWYLEAVLQQAQLEFMVIQLTPLHGAFPDMMLEFKTNATLEFLNALLEKDDLVDWHVMADTIRQCKLADNPLRR